MKDSTKVIKARKVFHVNTALNKARRIRKDAAMKAAAADKWERRMWMSPNATHLPRAFVDLYEDDAQAMPGVEVTELYGEVV